MRIFNTQRQRILKKFTPQIARLLTSIFFRFSKFPSNPYKSTGEKLIKEKIDTIRGIYMHIHKCGGTSLISAFKNNPAIISCTPRPCNLAESTGRERIPDTIFNKSIKFTFVRNPYARIVSAYNMFVTSIVWKILFPSFRDFVDFLQWTNVHEHQIEKEFVPEEDTRTIGNLIHHCSSYHNPKYMINRMDYIGKLETIDVDLKKISELLEIPPIKVGHHRKHQKDYDYRDFYDMETKKIITKLYQKDIDTFKYQF